MALGTLVAFSGENRQIEVQVEGVAALSTAGISYSHDGKTEKVEPSSIICADASVDQPKIFFLRDSSLFAIRSHTFNDKLGSYAPNMIPDEVRGHIIVSVLSGKCLAEPFYDNVVTPLLEHFNLLRRYTVHKTTSATTVTELAKDVFLSAATQGQKQHIVLLSGDGGIVDIVNELLSTNNLSDGYVAPEVSLIPMGTGNALAHSSKIFDGTNGLASWLRGTPRPLPLIRVEFSNASEGAFLLSDEGRKREQLAQRTSTGSLFWGAVVFSWGFHAQIVADSDTPEFRKHGIKRFGMAAQEALFPADGSGPHKYHGSLTVESSDDQGTMKWAQLGSNEHCYVLGTLCSNLEETFTISPSSAPFNGGIRLVHINHTSGDEIMRLMSLAYQGGKHIDDGAVDYEDVDGFAIQLEEDEDKWRRVCVDGKIILVEKGGSVQVHRETSVVVQLNSHLP